MALAAVGDEGDEPGAPLPDSMARRMRGLALDRERGERAVARAPGGQRHRARGKLTAHERLHALLDPGSFTELNGFAQRRPRASAAERAGFSAGPPGDGVVTGWGTVDGRAVAVYAHDARVQGGALGEVFAAKIHRIMDLAGSVGMPLIGLNDSGGARIQEGVDSLAGFGGIFARHVGLSGVVPQLSLVLGTCAGGAVYSPALTDFVVMVESVASMFITGPDVVSAVTGERVSTQELGGAAVHGPRSGVATLVTHDERAAFDQARALLSYLPANNQELPPSVRSDDDPDRRCDRLADIVPIADRRPYDMRAVIEEIVDDGEWLELQPQWAANLLCGFARLDGEVIGVVANQPAVLAGVLDIDASEKGARFVRACDAFNVPLVTLVDVPGFLPGPDQEHRGVIRRGATLLHAYCEATVPRVQLVLRKAFGGAYIVMDSRSIGADLSFAWPSNQIGVMGAEAAVGVLGARELAAAPDPARRRRELEAEYAREFLHPRAALLNAHVDDVIDPADSRRVLVRSLAMLRTKRARFPIRKHASGPV